MSATGIRRSRKSEKKLPSDRTVDVLYQRMGNRWFAFSLIDEEVFMGSISESELEKLADDVNPDLDKIKDNEPSL